MKTPPRLAPLVDDGVIDEVLGQVRSGKEADVFLVRLGDDIRCAKVYKDSAHRSFQQAAVYQEGRRVQNSRSARALNKRTAFGQKEAETNWITAEVQALNVLSKAGVRVPQPYGFFDGVLVMELVTNGLGEVAPRLNDISLSPETARAYHGFLIRQVVLMLCAGIIHGDLSEFNVLVDTDGPVIIDLPQAVNAAGNNHAQRMLQRDVDNLARYFGRFAPELSRLQYGKEIWSLYQNGLLTPHVELTGRFQETNSLLDLGGVMEAIEDARREHEQKLARKAQGPTRSEKSTPSQDAFRPAQGSDRGFPGRRDQKPPAGQGRPPQGGNHASTPGNRPQDPRRCSQNPSTQGSPQHPAQNPRPGQDQRQTHPSRPAQSRPQQPVAPSNRPIPPRPAPPPPPSKPSVVEIQPPKEIKWGRRPGR